MRRIFFIKEREGNADHKNLGARQNGQLSLGSASIKMRRATNNGLVNRGNLRLNESLKLTAKAEVVARHAKENELILANTPRNESVVRNVMGKVGNAAVPLYGILVVQECTTGLSSNPLASNHKEMPEHSVKVRK